MTIVPIEIFFANETKLYINQAPTLQENPWQKKKLQSSPGGILHLSILHMPMTPSVVPHHCRNCCGKKVVSTQAARKSPIFAGDIDPEGSMDRRRR